jgi:glycosyltransferase involved in cell wall biosynthesis
MSTVSVIVPSFRHETFIGEALASIYKQSYADIELILVDDRSPDSTFELARQMLSTNEYRRRFTTIQCQRNERNLGAHNTINIGLSLATGDWLSIINSDDAYHPERISRLLRHTEQTKSDLVFSGLSFLYGGQAPPWSDRLTMKRIMEAQENAWRYPSIRDALFAFNFCATTGNMMFSRRVFESLGGFWDLKYCHDWDYILRAAEDFQIGFLPEKLYQYRLHGGNSFKQLDNVARKESEFVAQGVRDRSKAKSLKKLDWDYGCLGLLAQWNGYTK